MDAKRAELLAVRQTVADRLFGGGTPEQIGRFVLQRRLGSGAMGTVHVAFDPDLERTVALKVVRLRGASAPPESRARLVREAQAMARLNHPNVVSVYEVGTFGEDVYIAMEYVEGQTLREWMQAQRRPWRDVAAKFEQAARGLAAAHDRGLVHRDFKPDNVLIAETATLPMTSVKVLDFGLARLEEQPIPSEPSMSDEGEPATSTSSASLTRTGATVGTPVYMAPEQHRGQSVPASDQFAFCAALYEALFGARPFDASRLSRLALAKQRGEVRPVPRRSSVPGWLLRLVLRGLAPDPAHRWPSMHAIAEALASRRQGRPRRWVLGTAAVLVVSGGLLFAARSGADDPIPCDPEAARRAWSEEERDAVGQAFAATAIPFQARAAKDVRSRLDGFVEAWSATAQRVCSGGKDRLGERLCLDRRLATLSSVVRLLREADEQTVIEASRLVGELGDPGRCVDAVGPRVADVYDHPKLVAAAKQLAAVDADAAAGRYRSARAAAEALAQTVEGLDPAFVAEVHLTLGRLRAKEGDARAAEQAHRRAIELAEREGLDVLAAHGWLERVYDALGRGDLDAAEDHLAIAEARSGREPGSMRLQADVEHARARIQFARGAFEDAVVSYEAASLARRGDPEHRAAELSDELGGLGQALTETGRYEAADEAMLQAEALLTEALGPNHPRVVDQRLDRAALAVRRDDPDAARTLLEGAFDDLQAVYGPRHRKLALVSHNLGNLALRDLRTDDAAEHFSRAVAISRSSLGESHPGLARALVGLGSAALESGRYAESIPSFDEAIEIATRVLGPEHIMVAWAKVNRAMARVRSEDHAAAIPDAEDALRVELEQLGADHPDVRLARVVLGQALVGVERYREAVDVLEPALASMTSGSDPPPDLRAAAEFALAQALTGSGDPDPRARGLAEAARDRLSDSKRDAQVGEITLWLETRR